MSDKHPTAWIWQQREWPEFSWDASALAAPLANARRAQGEVAGVAQFLDRGMHQSAQLEVLTTEGLATSAIEGETLDPDSLRSSLARRLGLPAVAARTPARSVEGLVEVLLDATQRYDQALTLTQLGAWQAALFPTGRSGLRGDEPMRIVSGSIGRERLHYEAPPRERLDQEMRRYLAWFNEPPTGLDGLLRACLAHGWFELIHPFEDGNGRVGRAILDRALAQDERRPVGLYSVSSRLMTVRDEYYGALERLSRGGLDVTSWLGWFLEQFAIAVRSSEQTIGRVMRKARFWVQHAQSGLNDRQRKALNSMLDAGVGGFVGGLTNRKYAHLTKASPATAQRDLAKLVRLGCLVPAGAGRSAYYVLPES